jgi:hypothetical protein
MKKVIFILVLAILIAGGIFAQEQNSNSRTHWVSGEVTIAGAGARYEYMLSPQLSVGGAAYYSSTFILYNDIGVDMFARYYPWAKTFFVGAGLGYHSTTILVMSDSGNQDFTGIAITPEIGWKIDVGLAGNWFIEPGIKVPLTIAFAGTMTGFQPGMPLVTFGLGYAF